LRVSVITAVYNREATVADALASVQAQRGVEVEHIVIDGASTDGTRRILEQHRERLAVLVSEPDAGIYDALNKGLARATGDVVGFMHADDLYAGPDALAKLAAQFERGSDAVYGDLQYVRASDPSHVVRHWRAGEFSPRRLGWGWMPPHPTLHLRREWYERVGRFDTGFRIAADYDFVLRLFSSPGLRVGYVPEVLVRMRLGGASNRSLRNIFTKSGEDLRALRNARVGGLGALAWKNLSKIGQFAV
jgi:glycosyltransferase